MLLFFLFPFGYFLYILLDISNTSYRYMFPGTFLLCPFKRIVLLFFFCYIWQPVTWHFNQEKEVSSS